MANSELLQKAIDCLAINDVYQVASNAKVSADFDPRISADSLMLQNKHIVEHSEVIELNDGERDAYVFRVFIELGARWVPPTDKDIGIVDQNTPPVMALIEATFVAEYVLSSIPENDALNAFALNNASYHVWPYWREYLMNQCLRMNLPKAVVPMTQFAKNADQVAIKDGVAAIESPDER